MKNLFKIGAVFSMALLLFVGCQKEPDKEAEKYKEQVDELAVKVDELQDQLNKKAEEEGASNAKSTPEVSDTVKLEPEQKEENIEAKEVLPVEEKKSEYKGESFIKITSPGNGAGFTVDPVIFTGNVSPNTEKIVVTANLPERGGDIGGDSVLDVHTLKDFELGDEKFVYRAKEEWGNLYPGSKHVFDFKAYFADGTSKTVSVTIEFMMVMESFIELDSPKEGKEFFTYDVPIEFKGRVSSNTTKIVVKAWQEGGYFEGYEDVYTLKGFKHGDNSFVYRTKKEWGNLARGPNNYEFTAYFDDGTTQTVDVSINYYDHAGEE